MRVVCAGSTPPGPAALRLGQTALDHRLEHEPDQIGHQGDHHRR
jgi:hypothetical protein